MSALKKIFVLLITILVANYASSQNAIAISSNPGPELRVALNWAPFSNPVGYNIFRKNATDGNYPAAPINSIVVKPLANCLSIKALLITSPDSAAWKLVARGLADSALFNPCMMNTLSKPSEKYDRLQLLARGNMPIAKAAGLGYEDNTVTAGQTYLYKIVALNAANTQIGIVAEDLKVTAGVFTPLPAPPNIVAEPGDGAVQVRWKEISGAGGYIIERSIVPVGLYRRVNESQYSTRVKHHLNGDTLIPNAEGFLDFQRYSSIGKPTFHVVFGFLISGPRNGITYFYRVKAIDIFGRAGLASATSNAAKPKDSTAPAVANDFVATPDNIAGSITVRWTQVTRDINGHWEQPDSSVRYRLYRFPTSENPETTPFVFIGGITPIKGVQTKDTTDADPVLRAPYGNKTWWYRLRSVDTSGNMSEWSPAVSAIIKDNKPPGIVKNLQATGFEDRIELKWGLNTEPDLASYMVYRSLCHLGDWVECSKRDTCKEWQSYNPLAQQQDVQFSAAGTPAPKLPCPCSGPFVFLGEITQDSAKRANTAGRMLIHDRTIPAGSPLCYAFWVKAKDSSDNLSGSFPIPSPLEQNEIICQRLRDLTPPEHALISGLSAQADQIKVEWMGPPTQDTRAYHVYRAEGKNPAAEPPVADFKWVGGMTVELPPTLPQVLTAPYTPPSLTVCEKISVQATPWMSQGFFEDKTIDPKKTYWYRIAGIDYDGNETPVSKAAPISTFTFSKKIFPAPIIDIIAAQAEPCGVVLQWSPVFDSAAHAGFIVYRSTSAGGPFTPIVVSPLKTNSFTDMQVVKGVTYWYRIATLMKNGRLSELTIAQSITP